MKEPSKKILICEDHQIVTDGLQSLIHSFDGFEVVDTVVNHDQLLISLQKQLPDILLLDLNLPGKNGIEILQHAIKGNYDFKVIVLTMYNKKSIVQKARSVGAHGFLLKNCSSEDLLDAMTHVSKENGFYYGEGVVQTAQKDPLKQDEFYKRIQLTPREKEIIRYLCNGDKVPDIAKSMHISPLTVETHKKNIYRKLNVNNTAKLLNFAYEARLL